MRIPIKSEKEISIMYEGGKVLSEIVLQLIQYVKPNISSADINNEAYKLCKKYNVRPAFLGYHLANKVYPASVCVCINEEVVHGIPDFKKIIKLGDIVTIDMGIIYKGYYVDMARTFGVGQISKEAQTAINASKAGLEEAIKKCVPENRLSDVCKSIHRTVSKYGCKPMFELVGHGIGKTLHEEPPIPGYWLDGVYKDCILKKGMIFAVESIVTTGKDVTVKISKKDGWTAYPKDRALTAAFEDTIAIDNPPIILTNLLH